MEVDNIEKAPVVDRQGELRQLANKGASELFYITDLFNREYKRIRDTYPICSKIQAPSEDGYLNVQVIL